MNRLTWAMGLVIAGAVTVAHAAPGDLDPTFNGTGIAVANSGQDRAQSLALDSSGNIVFGGYSGYFTNASFVNGRFDSAGVGGVLASTDFITNPGEGHSAEAVLVDGSDRIILVGAVNGRVNSAEVGIARFLADGVTLDSAFSGDGIFEFEFDVTAADARAQAAALDASGNIIVAGSSDGVTALARVTPAGVLDPTFDTDGVATGPGAIAQAVAVDGSGNIVVAANSSVSGGGTVIVSRFTPAGALDAGFGAGGSVNLPAAAIAGFDLAIDASGRIVVVGSSTGFGGMVVARLTSAGVVDATFNGSGTNTIDVSGGNDIAYGVDFDSGGGIVVAGSASGDSAVLRLLDDGTLDPAFGTAGIVELDIVAGGRDAAYDATVDSMDRILIAGRAHVSAGNGYDFYVARLEGAGGADLAITLADAPDPVNAGENLTYTVTVTNNGSGAADNVSATLPLPAGTGFVSATADTGGTCNASSPVTCTWAGSTADGASRVATIVASVPSSATGNLNATATTTSDTADPNLADNTADAMTGIAVVADLAITKTNGATASVPGTNTVYTIVASNAGPSDAPGSTVADTLPAACTSVSWTCVGAAGGTCTANGMGTINDVVNLPAGASVTYTATCAISPAALGTLDNTATVAVGAGASDPVPGNNSATDSDTLGASADLSLTKVASGVPNPLVLGSTFNYELAAANAGPSDATGVTVTDTLPANITHVSNTCAATFAAPTVTWNIGTLAAGGSANCTVTVSVVDYGPIANSASISAASGDPNGANNTGSVNLAGVPFPADVAITLTSNASTSLGVGSQFTYTVTGTNNGPGDANGLDFELALSNKVSFVSSDCGAVFAGGSATWSVATLANGASTTCNITVAVVASGDILATATVVTASEDLVPSNNFAELVVGFVAIAVPSLNHLGLLLMLAMIALVGGFWISRR